MQIEFVLNGIRYVYDPDVDRIGSGGYAHVYKARDEQGHVVALKILKDDPNPRHFENEIITMRRLNQYRYIAKLLDAGRGKKDGKETVYALVLEHIDGGQPLDAYCRENDALAAKIALLIQIAGALGHAHREGIIHRDLTPNNVLVSTAAIPYLLDFGIAKLLDSPSTLSRSQPPGTPQYMPPEAYKNPVYQPQYDVWSLGVLCYLLCCGRLPFGGDNTSTIMFAVCFGEAEPLPDAVPLPLHDICTRCLSKEPEERFADADAVVAALSEYLQQYWLEELERECGVAMQTVPVPRDLVPSADDWPQTRRKLQRCCNFIPPVLPCHVKTVGPEDKPDQVFLYSQKPQGRPLSVADPQHLATAIREALRQARELQFDPGMMSAEHIFVGERIEILGISWPYGFRAADARSLAVLLRNHVHADIAAELRQVVQLPYEDEDIFLVCDLLARSRECDFARLRNAIHSGTVKQASTAARDIVAIAWGEIRVLQGPAGELLSELQDPDSAAIITIIIGDERPDGNVVDHWQQRDVLGNMQKIWAQSTRSGVLAEITAVTEGYLDNATSTNYVAALSHAGILEAMVPTMSLPQHWQSRGRNACGYCEFVDANTGVVFIHIPAGPFWYGARQEEDPEAYGDERPQEPWQPVHVDEYFASETPVTCAQYRRFWDSTSKTARRALFSYAYELCGGDQWLAAAKKLDFAGESGWNFFYTVSGKRPFNNREELLQILAAGPQWWQQSQHAPSAWTGYTDEHPLIGVSWLEATAYCLWAGYGLPSELQWEKAARGAADRRKYTWGNEWLGDDCINSASLWRKHTYNDKEEWDAFLEQELWHTQTMTTPVHDPRFDQAISPYGVRDMLGNVFEWCSDYYEDPQYPAQTFRSCRGGSWGDPRCVSRVSYRDGDHPACRDVDLGFRVVLFAGVFPPLESEI